MTAFAAYQAKLAEHSHLQRRIEFKLGRIIETNWVPTDNEEEPYRFIAGAVFNYRGQFLRPHEP